MSDINIPGLIERNICLKPCHCGSTKLCISMARVSLQCDNCGIALNIGGDPPKTQQEYDAILNKLADTWNYRYPEQWVLTEDNKLKAIHTIKNDSFNMHYSAKGYAENKE